MPIPPPRRKLSKDNPEATPVSSATRLPRAISLTAKPLRDVLSVEASPLTRNGSTRRTFTKEAKTDSVPQLSPTKTVGKIAVKQQLAKSNLVPARTSEELQKLAFAQKNRVCSADQNGTNDATERFDTTRSTDASSLDLSNLHPSTYDSFESQPNVSKDSVGSAESNVPPRRNKHVPKIQRTSSQNGVARPTVRVSSADRSEQNSSQLSIASRSNLPSITPRKNRKVERSVSNDEPEAEIKPNNKPSYSESSLLSQPVKFVPARASKSVSKIPMSRSSAKSPAATPKPLNKFSQASGQQNIAETVRTGPTRITQSKDSNGPITLKSSKSFETQDIDGRNTFTTDNPRLMSNAPRQSDPITHKGVKGPGSAGTLETGGRSTSGYPRQISSPIAASGREIKTPSTPAIAVSNRLKTTILTKGASSNVIAVTETIKPPRVAKPVQRTTSLQNRARLNQSTPRPVVTAGIKSSPVKLDQALQSPAISAGKQEGGNRQLSAPDNQRSVNQSDDFVNSSLIESDTKQLIKSNENTRLSGVRNAKGPFTPTRIQSFRGSQMGQSSQRLGLIGKARNVGDLELPRDVCSKDVQVAGQVSSTAKVGESLIQTLDEGRWTGKMCQVEDKINTSMAASQDEGCVSTLTPSQEAGAPQINSTVAKLSTSSVSHESVYNTPDGNNIDADCHQTRINECNFLFARRRQFTQLSSVDSLDSAGKEQHVPTIKRFAGLVEKKANRVRDEIKNDSNKSEEKILFSKPPRRHRSDLSPEQLTFDPLGGCSTQGEILLLRSSVLPASKYPGKIPVVVNHELTGCQNNSSPVEKMQQDLKQLQSSDNIVRDKSEMCDGEKSVNEDTPGRVEGKALLGAKTEAVDSQCSEKENNEALKERKGKREATFVEKHPIPKPARPSLLRRAASSSALLVKSEQKAFVNSEILIVREDRTIVQIMTGASRNDSQDLKARYCSSASSSIAKGISEMVFGEALQIDSPVVESFDVMTINPDCDENEPLKLSSVTNNSVVAGKTDHPQIVARIAIPAECELEDIVVRTLAKKKSIDIVANDAGSEIQFSTSSDNELCEMLPPGYSMCEFDTSAFMQKLTTPSKHRNMYSVRSADGSQSRSTSPAKSVKEYETVYANIQRRNSEFAFENPNEIIYSNVRRASEFSRSSTPLGYSSSPLKYDPDRRVFIQEHPVTVPPMPPVTAPIEHETIYATIPQKAKGSDNTHNTRQYDSIYATYRNLKPEDYLKLKEHPQRVDYIHPINQKELFYSSDSPSVQEVSYKSGLNPKHLIDSCEYAEFVDLESTPSEFSASAFAPRHQDFHPKIRKAGHGLKAKIFRKMSSISKSKADTAVGTLYKQRSGETPEYATVPGPGHRKLYHSVSRELLSKMEEERQSIQGASGTLQDFDEMPETSVRELPEAVRYERFNPPVLSNRYSRVDLVEDPAFQSAVMLIGGEKRVVPLHREAIEDCDERYSNCETTRTSSLRNGFPQFQGNPEGGYRSNKPCLPSHWRTSDASRSHFPGAPEGQTRNSPNMEQRDSEIVEKNGDGICAMSVASDENDMGRNKNFRSHSAWDLRRPWSQSSCHRPDGNHLLIRKSSLESESPVACSRSSSPAPSTGSEGVLQKFRKSFSLRFHRRMAKPSDSTLPGADAQTESRLRDEDDTDSTFRFGPITWRASKDRKRTKKAASNRNSKCNSGDSGIQVTRPPSTDFESLGFVNEFPPTVTAGSPEDDARRQTRHYPLGGSATAPQSPADVASALWTNTVPDRSREESCFGSGRLRRTVSQPLRNEQPEEQEARRPSPEGCEVDFGVGYSSEDELETDRVTQTYEERPLDPLSSRDEGEALIAKALYDHTSVEPQELSFQKGDIFVITGFKDSEWWYGHISSAVGTGNASAVREEIQGWVPASFVKVTSRQEVEDADRKHFRTAAHLRSNVVNEILGTERDYVKHLEDIVEGYLDLMRQREDMFSPEQIVTIFRNIRPLFEFQKRFLRDLEASYSKETPHETCVGSCFLRHLSSFEVYSDYCTQQGAAIAELQSLCANDQKNQFLEGCRLLRGMRDIDLNGFLLKPVQRICQYHLQLEELRKRTDDNHSDHNDVNLAFHSMKGVANRINERTRQLQEMERLNQWQKMVEGWQGDNLTVKSSQVIYSGDVQKISHGGWAKDVTLYLFDRQAIICRKDLIKRNSLTYKARFSTEEGCEAVEVPDGKDTQYSTTVKFAFKVQDSSKKSYLFTCKTMKDRDKWIEEFRRDRRIQQGEEHRSLPDGASFDSMRRLESKGNKSANERPRLRHIKARPRVKKPDPVSVLPLQDVNVDGSTIRVDSSRNRTWFSKTKKRNTASSSEA